IADKYGYIEDRVFREVFRGKDGPRVPPPLTGSPYEKQRYLVEQTGRPVYFTTKTRVPGLEAYEMATWGAVYEVVKKGTKPKEEDHQAVWKKFRFRPGGLDLPP